MNQKIQVISAGIFCFAIGAFANNFAMSEVPQGYKVAVVDVSKVVNNSKTVVQLKEEQKKKIADLSNYVKSAKESIDKEKDPAKKSSLEEKYAKEVAEKRQAIEKEYTNKLIAIDKDIAAVIKEKSAANHYDLVLSKGVVLSGGEDITSQISSSVK